MKNERLVEATNRLRGIVEDDLLPQGLLDLTKAPEDVFHIKLERANKHAPIFENVYDGYGKLCQSIMIPAKTIGKEALKLLKQ